MIKAPQGELCLSCHSDLQDQAAKAGSRHDAFSHGDCTKCHSPHQAKLAKLALAPEPDLCLTCHKELSERMKGATKHSPVDDCSDCHQPHFSAQARLLQQPEGQLCGNCHDTADPGFGKAHLGIDPAVMHCAKCHEPHASKDPKLFKANVHAPFAGRSCGDCHVVQE
jgi:predicted CXXCH cytochrome family protein